MKALGRDMILAPTVNISRTPLWGRNFEGYGEDPYLAARMGVAYVQGVQGEGVIPSVKHFAANNQEFERHRIDETIDLRTLHEIYFPAFKAAVQEAGVVGGDVRLQQGERPVVRGEPVPADGDAAGSAGASRASSSPTGAAPTAPRRRSTPGMNLEMPGGEPMRGWLALPATQEAGNGGGWLTEEKVLAAIASGEVKQAAVDDNVRRILRVMFTAGLFDRPHAGGGEVDTPAQRAVARERRPRASCC